MILTRTVVLMTLTVASQCVQLTFPPSFKFGAATAAYQIEGAWNVSDKSESVWDVFVHQQPSPIDDGSTGDVACDSYHLWERDVEIAAEMNLDFYRFSLSWPRILPDGFSNRVSEDGIRYYNNLIDGLIARGIEPVVTIYHWDLPQKLQDLGGWTNPLIAEWFSDYARVVYEHFGNRVKTWLTINEPLVVCDIVYNTGTMGIPIQDDSIFPYICTKNLLLAHAKAWRVYDEEFKSLYNGKVSIANHFIWFEPASEDKEDIELSELANEFNIGRYSHPIYSKEGGWPPMLEKKVAENSAAEGFPRSRLPPFTPEEIDLIRGTYDFFGLNHYGARRIRKTKPGEAPYRWDMLVAYDLGDFVLEIGEDWTPTNAEWLFIYRESTRLVLSWLKDHYGDIEYFITETGISTKDGLDDQERVTHMREQLSQILLSIYEDGVDVTAYSYWSLIDNFEWTKGYVEKFGLYQVDYTDPAKTRTPRSSAKYYASVTANRALDKFYP